MAEMSMWHILSRVPPCFCVLANMHSEYHSFGCLNPTCHPNNTPSTSGDQKKDCLNSVEGNLAEFNA